VKYFTVVLIIHKTKVLKGFIVPFLSDLPRMEKSECVSKLPEYAVNDFFYLTNLGTSKWPHDQFVQQFSFSLTPRIVLSPVNHLREFIFSSFIHSFIHRWLCTPLLGPGFFFSFVIFFTQSVGLLGRVISPSQGRYLHKRQHTHRINAHTDIHDLSGIRTHDPSVRASEESSCLRPRGHSHHSPMYNNNHRVVCVV
jgi:hypothetical protein